MLARLVLVRHGPCCQVHASRFVDRAGVERWRSARDLVGLEPESRPPASLLRMAAGATHIVASDLRRAVASAEQLTTERPIGVSELLRETRLPIPAWPLRLPPRLWEALIHVGWGYRILRGVETTSDERARAAAAAEWLAGIGGDDSMALAVTHGVFRRLLATQLIALGWTSTGRRGGYGHWSAWSFTAPRKRYFR